MFRIKNLADVLRDKNIPKHEKMSVLKCYKFVKEYHEDTGIEPLQGNTCITVDGGYHHVKIHLNRTITYLQTLKGNSADYMKLGMKYNIH